MVFLLLMQNINNNNNKMSSAYFLPSLINETLPFFWNLCSHTNSLPQDSLHLEVTDMIHFVCYFLDFPLIPLSMNVVERIELDFKTDFGLHLMKSHYIFFRVLTFLPSTLFLRFSVEIFSTVDFINQYTTFYACIFNTNVHWVISLFSSFICFSECFGTHLLCKSKLFLRTYH